MISLYILKLILGARTVVHFVEIDIRQVDIVFYFKLAIFSIPAGHRRNFGHGSTFDGERGSSAIRQIPQEFVDAVVTE